ncbi:MAG: class I tRNA ligase family protein, partial [Candidatus Micrarchaeia archaeon]
KRLYEVFERIKKEDIYKGYYEGFYCDGCEAFLLESELENGLCPLHKKEPKFYREENYFFKLSNYQDEILKILKGNFVYPESRKNEMINFVKGGLKDISISRPNLTWGIDFPLDKNHKVWVWFDALVNYLQPLDYWPADLHLIGKDILRFHAVIWPAMLISAGFQPPRKIFAHGYFTVNGQKMSKTLGNVIDPIKMCEKYGEDPLRYYILRDIPFGEDGDFSEKSLIERTNNELVANYGNLFYRVTYFVEKNFGYVKRPDMLGEIEVSLIEKIKSTKTLVDKLIDDVKLTEALGAIMDLSSEINKYFQQKEPWKKIRSENEEDRKDLDLTLYTSVNSIYSLSCLLYPFMPRTCESAVEALGRKVEWNFEEFKIEGKINSKILFRKI